MIDNSEESNSLEFDELEDFDYQDGEKVIEGILH